jgi:parallel beta-helix repeat protein
MIKRISSGALVLLVIWIVGLVAHGSIAGAAPVDPDDPAPTSQCDLSTSGPTYSGSSDERDLTALPNDPYKMANYPCAFPADIRAMRLDRISPTVSTVSLVAAGKLVRSYSFATDAGGVVRLEAIAKAVNDPAWVSMPAPGIVQLALGLVQEAGSQLLIASPGVTQVRLAALNTGLVGTGASVVFQGVDVTSWSAASGAPMTQPDKGRPFIVYKGGGRIDATGSTFHNLGSDVASGYGVTWRLDTAGTVTNCVFEDNFFGVYTYRTSGVVWQDSIFRDNTWYGLDPHTYSSGLTIVNNEVYGNGHHGIVFSQYVTDSVVEGNYVHDNVVNGIMMDFRSSGNTIRNNRVVGNGQGIVLTGSGANEVVANAVTGNGIGIRASHDGADGNNIHDNTIDGGRIGVDLYGGATTTLVQRNWVSGTSQYGMSIDAPRSTILANTIMQTPVGIRVQTVATVSAGQVLATKTAIEVDNEGFATIDGVAVGGGGSALRVAPTSVVQLHNTEFGLPVPRSAPSGESVSLLDKVGVGLIVFAALCEVLHLIRRRGMRRLTGVMWGGVALAGIPSSSLRAPYRLLVRAPAPTRATGSTASLHRGSAVAPSARHATAPPEASTVVVAKKAATAPGRRFRPDIEGLRAIAVGAVVLNHTGLGVPGGYVGVDVFLVISGFLITRQLLTEVESRGRISFAGFYARRIRRILPAATIVSLATLWGAYMWAPPLRRASIGQDGLASAFFSLNWRLAQQGTDYFRSAGPASPFQHYWTLSVEEQFYVLWPLILAAVALFIRDRRQRTRAIAIVLWTIVLVSLMASIHITRSSHSYAYFGTHTRAWELALGALVALGANRLRSLPRLVAAVLGWAGLGAIVVACAIYGAGTTYPGSAVILPVAGAALIIAAGSGAAVPRFGAERLLALPPMRWIGRLSYSLYLWHWPLIILLPDALGHPLSTLQTFAAIGAALVLSGLTYIFVEQPFSRQRGLIAHPRRAFALAAVLICGTAAAALVLAATAPTDDQGRSTTPTVVAALQAAANGGVVTAPDITDDVTTLPADVTPALDQAAEDFPDSQGCEIAIQDTNPKLPCDQFGDPNGDTSVVLVGDSHAGQWLGALDSIAKSEHWKLTVLAKAGCPLGAYTDYENETGAGGTDRCNSWRTQMLALVAAQRPDIVIIGSQARKVADTESEKLSEVITKLGSGGARVVFLGDTPAPRTVGDIPDCLSKNTSQVQNCAIARTDGIDTPGRSAEMQAAAAAGARVIDPSAWFCSATVCPAVVDKYVVYADASHITATYAMLRAPQLQSALETAVS